MVFLNTERRTITNVKPLFTYSMITSISADYASVVIVPKSFGLVYLMLNAPVNNISVMLGRSHRFLGITSPFFFFFFFFLGGGGVKYVLLKDITRRPEWG